MAIFGGGCFWCTEAVFSGLKGVVSVISGYAGGPSAGSGQAPTYEEVSTGKTGHAEVVKVEYDPAQISYEDLLTVFFATHDPTTPNKQGNDVGEQYRSVILYANEAQKRVTEEFIAKLEADEVFAGEIVTELIPLAAFYPAEREHIEYYKRNSNKPYCQIVIAPKIAKLQQKFATLLKQS